MSRPACWETIPAAETDYQGSRISRIHVAVLVLILTLLLAGGTASAMSATDASDIHPGVQHSPMSSGSAQVAARYDANSNNMIELDEVEAAIGDYFGGTIALADVEAIIGLYFSGGLIDPDAEKEYMLGLINEERMNAEVPPVVLGDNTAAQLHAESMLANCFSSHWGVDGLKPYMRYSLAGGYQHNAENVSGLDYCITPSDGYRTTGVREGIRRAMTGFMDSPGHRRQILHQWHRKVNIGLAWSDYNIMVVQHFEGDYVEYDSLPSIQGDVLSFAGQTKNRVQFDEEKDLGISLYHDPLPHALTPGQLARTYCVDSGRKVAAFRPPLEEGSTYTNDEFTTTYTPCPSPYDVPPDTPAPGSPEEAHDAWREARDASLQIEPQSVTVPWITASRWSAGEDGFAISADISRVLREHGSGVYTVLVWGVIDDTDVPISQYSMWVVREE